MNISYHTVEDNLDTSRGYGAAGARVVKALQDLGHNVYFDSDKAPVQISFCQPSWYKFHENQYKIGYTPWESTELPHGWVECMNRCDEVWATSDWVANVFRNAGVTKPIKVYKHGLDSRFSPIKRTKTDKVRFLHIGEPALRKGGQLALDAFRQVFGDQDDVHLTVKAYHQHYLRTWYDGEVVVPDKVFDNVSIITEQLDFQRMIDLYASHDVLVYPSYGEGFGFIPLQALGTGMPTISTYEWAPYANFLGELKLSASVERSIWSLHPGNVFYPNFEHLKILMQRAYDKIEWLHEDYYASAPAVHEEYNWLRLTENAFAHIVERFTEK